MYSNIVDPETNQTFNITSKYGKKILRKYINQLGGSATKEDVPTSRGSAQHKKKITIAQSAYIKDVIKKNGCNLAIFFKLKPYIMKIVTQAKRGDEVKTVNGLVQKIKRFVSKECRSNIKLQIINDLSDLIMEYVKVNNDYPDDITNIIVRLAGDKEEIVKEYKLDEEKFKLNEETAVAASEQAIRKQRQKEAAGAAGDGSGGAAEEQRQQYVKEAETAAAGGGGGGAVDELYALKFKMQQREQQEKIHTEALAYLINFHRQNHIKFLKYMDSNWQSVTDSPLPVMSSNSNILRALRIVGEDHMIYQLIIKLGLIFDLLTCIYTIKFQPQNHVAIHSKWRETLSKYGTEITITETPYSNLYISSLETYNFFVQSLLTLRYTELTQIARSHFW